MNTSGIVFLQASNCIDDAPPTFDNDITPKHGTCFITNVGNLVSFSVNATDNQSNDVTLQALSLPQSASMEPALPYSGNPVTSVFTWVPSQSDTGIHVIKFKVTDICGYVSFRFVNIMVQAKTSFVNSISVVDSNNSSDSGRVFFGVHSLASECIDSLLGEVNLPPQPLGYSPPYVNEAMFEARLTPVRWNNNYSCIGIGTTLDLRKLNSSSQIDTYKVRVNLRNSNNTLLLSWSDLRNFYSGNVQLVYPTDGSMLQVNMKAQNSTSISNSEITSEGVYIIAEGPQATTQMTSTIIGRVFNDYNSNGIRESNELGLSWWIHLRRNEILIDSILSDNNGYYSFVGLNNGTYMVSEVKQNGWTQTSPQSPGTYTVTIDSVTTITGKDFGNYLPTSISGMKFNDLDGNGIKNGGEPGLPNWRIRLITNGSQVDSLLTDASGGYSFSKIIPGTYSVREKQESGWTCTFPSGCQYTGISISSGSIITGKDFGNCQPSSVSMIVGTKFNDLNGNGSRQTNEPGLGNWRIILSGPRVDSTFTMVRETMLSQI